MLNEISFKEALTKIKNLEGFCNERSCRCRAIEFNSLYYNFVFRFCPKTNKSSKFCILCGEEVKEMELCSCHIIKDRNNKKFLSLSLVIFYFIYYIILITYLT